jgi:integrase
MNKMNQHAHMDSIIKSVRVFEKNGYVHLDYRVHDEYQKDGKTRTRSSTDEPYSKRTIAKIEREKFSRAKEHYLTNNVIREENNPTVGDIALDALNDGKSSRNEDTHKDILSIYENDIKPYFEDRYIKEIKVSDIKRWKDRLLTGKFLSKQRYAKYHRCLNFIFHYALVNEIIDKNPVVLVDRKSKLFTKSKNSLEKKYYSAKEVEKLLSTATGWFRVMLLFYINTGVRTGEGLALKWSDIDFENRSIAIQRSIRAGKLSESTKTGSDRLIVMSKPLKEALLTYKEVAPSDTWVFINPYTNKPFTSSKSIIHRYFKPLLKECQIKYSRFYILRHTFASLSAKKGIPMTVISKQLGHANPSVTMKYYVQHNLLDNDNDIDIFDKIYA